MEIKTLDGHTTITIKTKNIDFDTLVDQINLIPLYFINHITMRLDISKVTYYKKKRDKSFRKLEKEALSDLTGISIELL